MLVAALKMQGNNSLAWGSSPNHEEDKLCKRLTEVEQ